MAAALKKNHSRRRLAALTFLSNISLDGSHRDTKLAHWSQNGTSVANNNTSTIIEEESPQQEQQVQNGDSLARPIDIDPFVDEGLDGNDTEDNDLQDKVEISQGTEPQHTSFSSDSEGMLTPAKATVVALLDQNVHCPPLSSSIRNSFRERAGTTGSDYSLSDRRVIDSLQYKKRMNCQSSALTEDIKHPYHSSTESIGSLRFKTQFSRAKSKALSNVHTSDTATPPGSTNSDSVPEVTRELCLMQRPVNGNKYDDDRLVLLSSKVPLIVFSALPYNKGQRSSWSDVRKDNGRKKPVQSQRPLSSINDSVDAFGLLGIERGNDGQEISYGQLLEPSRQFTKDRKLHTNDNEALELMHFVPNKHQLVSRYLTNETLSMTFYND